MEADVDMVKTNDDASSLFDNNDHTGANVIRSSLHSTINQPSRLINRFEFSSAPRKKHFRKFSHSKNFSSNLFQSTGSNKQQLRNAKRIKAILENRLKRFRMLDQDEFQAMLTSLSQQAAEEQSKSSDAIDALGGMQLASKRIRLKPQFNISFSLSLFQIIGHQFK